jgi:hypothetical protein
LRSTSADSSRDTITKIIKSKITGGVAQVSGHVLCKCEASLQTPTPTTTTTTTKEMEIFLTELLKEEF